MNSKAEPRSVRTGKKTNNYVSQNRRPDEPLNQRNEVPVKKPQRNDLAAMVAEYLEFSGCSRALEYFKQEAERPKPSGDKATVLGYFDSGSRDLFFARLSKLVPPEVKQGSEAFRKLEFYLHVYFFAIKRPAGDNSSAHQHFVAYLESRGEQLSKTTELLPFFALHYMPRPQEHKAIEHIFRKKWSTDLREKLSKFLDECCSKKGLCRLEQLYHGNGGAPAKSPSSIGSSITSQKEHQLLTALSDYKLRYAKLQQNYHEMTEVAKSNLLDSQAKWFSLARDLVSIGNKFIRLTRDRGLMNGPLNALADKFGKYEIFLNSNLDDLIAHSNQGISIFEQQSCSELEVSNTQHALQNKNRSTTPMLSLDYEKIKDFLRQNRSEVETALLLQALRWRITKNKDPYARREIIMSYTLNDIMGVRPQNASLLESLFSISELVREQSLRLANAIASDFYGRSYVIDDGTLLRKLVKIVKEEDYDGTIRRCALNALQKVSLRSGAQIFMIENDIIRWIVQTIKLERDDLSECSLQYLTALLMNMTLKKLGKAKCERQQILQLLVDLLENESPEVRTFVSGSIFSLVGQPKLREEAARIRLEQQLEKYRSSDQPQQFVKQIEYVLQKLEEPPDEDEEEEEENDIDDIDEEEELDEGDDEEFGDDSLENAEGENRFDVGQNLLIKRFSCVGPEAVRQQCLTRSILEEAVKKNLEISIIRQKKTNRSFTNTPFKPTTPAKSSLEILDVMDEHARNQQQRPHQREQPQREHQQEHSDKPIYDSNNYLLNYVSFKKQPANRQEQEELKQFMPRPLIPRTPPQTHHK